MLWITKGRSDLYHFRKRQREKKQKMQELYDEIARNVLPVRKDRHFSRHPVSRKYSQN